ncbi:MAG: exo-alpha-sialidase [Bacteroidales bacterium]|nr:exo-alpha-sialidase [Bacteroidales bacterium]
MKRIILMTLVAFASALSLSAAAPVSVLDGLFNASNTNTLGLTMAEGTETITVFAPSNATDHFSHGAVMIAFKGNLYCMWQSSKQDEDSEDTWVAYSRSEDEGATWSQPMVLAESIANGYCSSGGWYATEDSLIGYINTWPAGLNPKGGYTRYVASADGINWTAPADVLMADGSRLNGIFEQDPHVLPDGRIVNAAHMQPGLHITPLYTDDASGLRGWKRGEFAYTDNGAQSVEMEPSLFQQANGDLVMIFRDQNSSYRKLAAVSKDRGETWSKAQKTNMPDARTKQSAGNLPDGTAFMAGNPVSNKRRVPLVLTLSSDGNVFNQAYLLRSDDDIQALRYPGKAKSSNSGYSYPKSMVAGDYLYVSYATNKEDIQFTRVPLASIALNTTDLRPADMSEVLSFAIFHLNGTLVYRSMEGESLQHFDWSSLDNGVYVLQMHAAQTIQSKLISVKK